MYMYAAKIYGPVKKFASDKSRLFGVVYEALVNKNTPDQIMATTQGLNEPDLSHCNDFPLLALHENQLCCGNNESYANIHGTFVADLEEEALREAQQLLGSIENQECTPWPFVLTRGHFLPSLRLDAFPLERCLRPTGRGKPTRQRRRSKRPLSKPTPCLP